MGRGVGLGRKEFMGCLDALLTFENKYIFICPTSLKIFLLLSPTNMPVLEVASREIQRSRVQDPF